MTALANAHHRFLATVITRPRELRPLNSADALAGRTLEIELHVQAVTVWLKALVEDTAGHCHASRSLSDLVETYMSDLASELRGELIVALEDVETAA